MPVKIIFWITLRMLWTDYKCYPIRISWAWRESNIAQDATRMGIIILDHAPKNRCTDAIHWNNNWIKTLMKRLNHTCTEWTAPKLMLFYANIPCLLFCTSIFFHWLILFAPKICPIIIVPITCAINLCAITFALLSMRQKLTFALSYLWHYHCTTIIAPLSLR